MFKSLKRQTQKKQNFMITVRLARFGVSAMPVDTSFHVVWKRGPEKQSSNKLDLNEFEIDADMSDVMSKVSSFYSRDNVAFDKKFCNFIIMKLGDGDYQSQVAQVEVDMAEYVNHTDSLQKIIIPCDDYDGMFLEVLWTISATDERGGTSISTELSLNLGSEIKNMTDEQLQEIFEKAKMLEDQNSDLEHQIDLVISAKNSLEKILNEERK